MDSLCH